MSSVPLLLRWSQGRSRDCVVEKGRKNSKTINTLRITPAVNIIGSSSKLLRVGSQGCEEFKVAPAASD